MFKGLIECNREDLYVADDVFNRDRDEEKSDNSDHDYEIAKLKAKIKNLRSDIDYKNQQYEKLFSLYYDKHPQEVENIISNNLLR